MSDLTTTFRVFFPSSFRGFGLVVAFTFFICLFAAQSAQAQARLIFSGGGGAPLSTTLRTAVIYTITNANCAGAQGGPIFIFQASGNPFATNVTSVTGTINYSINNGTSQPLTNENSGFNAGDITANDTYAYGSLPGLSASNMVILSAGTITTAGNIAATKPADGNYITFIAGSNGLRCSDDGVSLASTAATVPISGYVTSNLGRGISGIQLSLTDSQGNTRTTSTATGGYYRFEDVQAGETYILSASGKRFTFSQPVQVLNVTEETNEVNFIANSQKRLRSF